MKTTKFVVEIEVEGDAFCDAYHADREIARLLRRTADKVENEGTPYSTNVTLLDVNGNSCGFYYFGRALHVAKRR